MSGQQLPDPKPWFMCPESHTAAGITAKQLSRHHVVMLMTRMCELRGMAANQTSAASPLPLATMVIVHAYHE